MEDSLTYFTAWFRGLQHLFTSAAVTHSEGPEGPMIGTYPVARSAGNYSWYVHASATTDPDADWALAYADMPIPPSPTNVVKELT